MKPSVQSVVLDAIREGEASGWRWFTPSWVATRTGIAAGVARAALVDMAELGLVRVRAMVECPKPDCHADAVQNAFLADPGLLRLSAACPVCSRAVRYRREDVYLEYQVASTTEADGEERPGGVKPPGRQSGASHSSLGERPLPEPTRTLADRDASYSAEEKQRLQAIDRTARVTVPLAQSAMDNVTKIIVALITALGLAGLLALRDALNPGEQSAAASVEDPPEIEVDLHRSAESEP